MAEYKFGLSTLKTCFQDLGNFINYRVRKLEEATETAWHRTDVSHILYGGDFQGGTIGSAFISTMCGEKSGSVVQVLVTVV